MTQFICFASKLLSLVIETVKLLSNVAGQPGFLLFPSIRKYSTNFV